MLDFGFYNMDCMDGMSEFPDKYFDLAIVDPPYGIGKKLLNGGKTGKVKFHEMYELNEWDNYRPDKSYFQELFRVSKNQIIWGGNYYIDFLFPTRGIIVWDKNIGEPYNFSHFELAWTSFDCIARKVVISSNTGRKIHPTQKPVALYEWLLSLYAKDGDIILDTHVGSASSLIACRNTNHKYVGFEINEDYYKQAKDRLDAETAQMNIYDFL